MVLGVAVGGRVQRTFGFRSFVTKERYNCCDFVSTLSFRFVQLAFGSIFHIVSVKTLEGLYIFALSLQDIYAEEGSRYTLVILLGKYYLEKTTKHDIHTK